MYIFAYNLIQINFFKVWILRYSSIAEIVKSEVRIMFASRPHKVKFVAIKISS